MTYDFNKIIDRRNTNSLKYDFAVKRNKPENVLPLWVADMDFQAPDEVIDALVDASKHGIYGYSDTNDSYFNAVHNWFKTYFNWETERQWLVKSPGVVYSISLAVNAFTKEGDSVLIQQPVYYPFSEAIISNNRKLVNNPLHYENGKYSIDFVDFEEKIVSNNVKLFILCSPHNPVGRVWTKDELITMGNICLKHNVIVLADEIHADFTYNNYTHTIFASISPEFSNITITCTAPGKTFNMAGLQVANVFIEDLAIRKKFIHQYKRSGYSQLNKFGLVGCQAAYTHGRKWLDELKQYLVENLNFSRDFISKRLPSIKLVEPEGTYLLWLDFSQLGLSEEELEDLILNKANLWLDSGKMFGPDGCGFERINMACPKAILEKAFLQLEAAINAL